MAIKTLSNRYDLSSILFVALITLPAINYYIAEIYWSVGLKNSWAEYVYAFVFAVGIISVCIKPSGFKAIAILTIIFLLLYTSLVTPRAVPIYTSPSFLRSPLGQFLLVYFPIFLLSSDKRFNYDRTLRLLSSVAIVPLVFMIIAYVLQVYVIGLGLHEYMTFAYTALPMIMVVMYYSWTVKQRWLGKIVSVISAFTILFGGCRGALLSLLAFIVLSILLYSKSNTWKFILIFAGFFITINLSQVLQFFGSQLSSLGVESRIFSFIDAGTIAESDARIEVFKKAISIIDVYGHGIYSDRALLEHVADATYCHNWMLEFLVDYGWIIGMLLIIVVLSRMIRLVVHTTQRSPIMHKFMIYFALSMLGVKFMLSNSYLNSPELAFVFGWMFYLSRNKNQYATT